MIKVWIAQLFNLDLIAMAWGAGSIVRFARHSHDGAVYVRAYGNVYWESDKYKTFHYIHRAQSGQQSEEK